MILYTYKECVCACVRVCVCADSSSINVPDTIISYTTGKIIYDEGIAVAMNKNMI